MKINCISCGHKLDIGDAYGDYEGAVKCFVCGTLLEIRTEQGSLRSMKLLSNLPPSFTEEAIEKTVQSEVRNIE